MPFGSLESEIRLGYCCRGKYWTKNICPGYFQVQMYFAWQRWNLYAISQTKPSLQHDETECVLSQRYLDEAEREKMQYAQELKEYQQTEAYQISSAKIQDKKMRKGDGYLLHY